MTPKGYFDEVWQRCELFAALYGYMANHATAALQPDELLRAEWAASETGREARFYTLTRVGRKQLDEQSENWDRLSAVITGILRTAE